MSEAGGDFGRTEQEEKCDRIYQDLEKLFRKLQKANKPDRINACLKDITTKLKEAKALVKDFEREARADGMPPRELAERRRILADELNRFINLKKEFSSAEGAKGELFDGAAAKADVEVGMDGMTTQQLISKGRKDITEIDKTLERAERLVEDTKQVGTATAATLHDQTKQLNKIMDDVNEIEFNMKKASAVIRDITRGLLTDKCIGFLLFLVTAGVVAIIVLKVVNPNKKKIADAAANSTIFQAANNTINNAVNNAVDAAGNAINNAVNSATGRRMLLDAILEFANNDAW